MKKITDPLVLMRAKARLRKEVAKGILIVRSFLDTRRGRLIVLSDDMIFAALLRSCVRTIGARSLDIVFTTQDRESFLAKISDSLDAGETPLLIIEEKMRSGISNMDILRSIAGNVENHGLLVSTTSQDAAVHALFSDIGADGVVLKPADNNSLTIAIASAAREKSPEETLIQKALSLAAAGDGEDAFHIASVVVRARPDNPSGYLAMGDACEARGDRKRAVLAWRMANLHDKSFIPPMEKLAMAARDENDTDGELAWLMRMDTISPLNGKRKAEIADACLRAGMTDEAARHIEQAWRNVDEGIREELRSLSVRFADMTRAESPEKAERFLRKSLDERKTKLGISDMHAFNLLGLVLRAQGKNSEALREYRRALRVSPENPGILYNMAMAMFETHDVKGAADALRRAMATSTDILFSEKNIARNMAAIFLAAKDYHFLETTLAAVVEMDPEDQKAADMLRRIRKYMV